MRSIGIRELRQNASKYLRLVREGETIQVTDRGEPIAMITPCRDEPDRIEQLRREGKIHGPEKPFDLSSIVPVEPREGAPSVAEMLDESRADRL